MNQTEVIRILCNMFAIIYSTYISMAIYQFIDSIMNVDASGYLNKPLFRADNTQLQDIVYQQIDFYHESSKEAEHEDEDEDEDQDDRKYEHAIPPTQDRFLKEGFSIYSPVQVCYVNSYIIHDSNSTSFDYEKETEYDIEHMYDQFAELNKMYLIFDDIHMVFSIKHQQCIKYPDIYRNDEL